LLSISPLSLIFCTLSSLMPGVENFCRTAKRKRKKSERKRTKANESFDNGFFFDIEAKRIRSIVGKFIS
jgi:hypothetical protein